MEVRGTNDMFADRSRPVRTTRLLIAYLNSKITECLFDGALRFGMIAAVCVTLTLETGGERCWEGIAQIRVGAGEVTRTAGH